MNEGRHNYTIIRCQTTDKNKVMGLIYCGEEYKIINNHIDIVYYNGDNPAEKKETKELVKEDIETLKRNEILADSKPQYIDDWFIIPKHY